MNELQEIRIIAQIWQDHDDKNVRELMCLIFILAKRAQQEFYLTVFSVGFLFFLAGVVVGKILEAG